MNHDNPATHDFKPHHRYNHLCDAAMPLKISPYWTPCGQPRDAAIHRAAEDPLAVPTQDAPPSVQCDRCKNWVPQDTVKVQAGVTFCARCQEEFVDWVATEANVAQDAEATAPPIEPLGELSDEQLDKIMLNLSTASDAKLRVLLRGMIGHYRVLRTTHDDEITRLQDGIRDYLVKQWDVPDDRIDGAGCDSGDPLDFTKAEIGQAISFLIDAHDAEVSRLREALAACAIPYEALLADSESRKWIAPEVWSEIEKSVAAARSAIKGEPTLSIAQQLLDDGKIVKDFHTGQMVVRFSRKDIFLNCANCGQVTDRYDHLYGWHICLNCDSDETASEIARDVMSV